MRRAREKKFILKAFFINAYKFYELHCTHHNNIWYIIDLCHISLYTYILLCERRRIHIYHVETTVVFHVFFKRQKIYIIMRLMWPHINFISTFSHFFLVFFKRIINKWWNFIALAFSFQLLNSFFRFDDKKKKKKTKR